MSDMADFTLLPRTTLPQLAEIADKPGWHDFLESKGKDLVDFNWPGPVFYPLMGYLSREIGMDSGKFEFAELSGELSRKRGLFCEIFGAREKNQFLEKLNPHTFLPEVLGSFAASFSKVNLPDAGEAMLAGIRALERGLSQVDDSNVLVLSIG